MPRSRTEPSGRKVSELTEKEKDALFQKHIVPGLHPMLASYQKKHALEQVRIRFDDSPRDDVATALAKCKKLVVRFLPTVDDDGKPMDPRKLEALKKAAS
jgi:hypothetical protein